MNIAWIKYLVAIAEMKSINKVAEKFARSRSALISALNDMERETGRTLFVRTHGGTTLTAEGLRIYEDCKTILGLMDSWYRNGAENRAKTQIRLHFLPALMEIFSVDVLSRLIDRFPSYCFSSSTITNNLKTMFRLLAPDADVWPVVLGGYYNLEQALFQSLAEKQDVSILPLFSSGHYLYYNEKLEDLVRRCATTPELLEHGARVVYFREHKSSLLVNWLTDRRKVIVVSSLRHAFSLISSNAMIVGLFPSFLTRQGHIPCTNIRHRSLEDDSIRIDYCLLHHRSLGDVGEFARVVENVSAVILGTGLR